MPWLVFAASVTFILSVGSLFVFINLALGKKVILTNVMVLFGVDHADIQCSQEIAKKINHLILVEKMCISKFKYGKGYDLLITFSIECGLRGLNKHFDSLL